MTKAELAWLNKTNREIAEHSHAGRFEEAEAAYRRALELHAELDNRGREVETKAGFAVTLHALGKEDEARSLVDEVVAHIRHTGAGGIEDPVDALLACRQVLDAQGDAAAAADAGAGV